MSNRAAEREESTVAMEEQRIDIHSHFVHALRTQKSHKAESQPSGPLSCPYGHNGRMFPNFQQLLDHIKLEHSSDVSGLDDVQLRFRVREAVVKAR